MFLIIVIPLIALCWMSYIYDKSRSEVYCLKGKIFSLYKKYNIPLEEVNKIILINDGEEEWEGFEEFKEKLKI